jgi:hypothetical protein
VNPPGQSLNQYKFRTQSKRAKFKLWTTRHTAEKQVSLILRTAHISEHKQRKCLHLWLRMNPGTVSISTQTPSPRQWCCWCDHWVRIPAFLPINISLTSVVDLTLKNVDGHKTDQRFGNSKIYFWNYF